MVLRIMKMIWLNKQDIPLYLRNSDLYFALSDCDESLFAIPSKFCNGVINPLQSLNDVEQLLETLSFWLINELPSELIDYAVKEDPMVFDELFRRFERTVPELDILRKVANNNFSNRYNIIARYGSVRLMHYFKEKGEFGFWDEGVCKEAIMYGRLSCLQFAHQHGCAFPADACTLAAKQGHLSCLKYIHEQGVALPASLCDFIAWNGHCDCLKYAHQQGCVLSPSIMTITTKRHFWDCVKYAYENGLGFSEDICVEATRANRLDMMVYAHQRGADLRGSAYIALSLGRLDCFKYAYSQETQLRDVFAEVAAGGGHLECLRHVLELHAALGVRISDNVCYLAARAGSLQCLQLAHSAGCSWNARTCEAAASKGHLECLAYAHTHGCKWGAKAAHFAAENGHWACWRYLYWNKCPDTLAACMKSALCGLFKK